LVLNRSQTSRTANGSTWKVRSGRHLARVGARFFEVRGAPVPVPQVRARSLGANLGYR
jgi:hypothetical protein